MKQKLGITAAQEGAWNAWTAALKPPAQRAQRPDREAIARMTTPERIDRMRALRAERQARMDSRANATKTFYAALAPEQQKTFDQLSLRMMRRARPSGRPPPWWRPPRLRVGRVGPSRRYVEGARTAARSAAAGS